MIDRIHSKNPGPLFFIGKEKNPLEISSDFVYLMRIRKKNLYMI